MSRWVVDASVAVKWVVTEEHNDIAVRLWQDADELHAPAHWLAEATNTLWAMRCFRSEITDTEMHNAIFILAATSVISKPLPALAQKAAAISASLGITVYDSLYVALAAEIDLPFVTADRKLVAKIRGSAHEGRTQWIGDLA